MTRTRSTPSSSTPWTTCSSRSTSGGSASHWTGCASELGAGATDDRLDRLLASLAPRTQWLERIPAKVANRVTLVPVGEIQWIEAADNYVRLHTAEGQYAVRETMNNLAEQLDPRQFARVHRSTIVNLGRVKEMLALASGDYTVVLEGGTRLTLSRGYRKAFEQQIGRALS